MSKQIPLTQNKFATVDDEDFERLSQFKWCAAKMGNGEFYAKRRATLTERLTGAPSEILMHVVVNNTPRGYYTDHINRDTLDNRRSNLRSATPQQNKQNQGKLKTNSSGYKGVSFCKAKRKWQATISVNSKNQHIGFHETAEAAARAYDTEARKYHGEFAKLNFE